MPTIIPKVYQTLGDTIDDHGPGVQIMVDCSQCGRAHNFTHDELVALAAKVGRDYSLIDRRCRCRLTEGCTGWNAFHYLNGVMRPLCRAGTQHAWFARDFDEERGLPRLDGAA